MRKITLRVAHFVQARPCSLSHWSFSDKPITCCRFPCSSTSGKDLYFNFSDAFDSDLYFRVKFGRKYFFVSYYKG